MTNSSHPEGQRLRRGRHTDPRPDRDVARLVSPLRPHRGGPDTVVRAV